MQPTATIHLGDNRDILKTIETNSIDSVVTDPPYELGFMGKAWDASGIAYQVTLWAEVLRVLKPGGHLLAFGGTRTYHRMAVAIEDAGFEIRDSIHWIYGSGFPKSLDVSKAIDKAAGAERERYARPAFGGTFSDDNGTTYGTAISDNAVTPEAKQWQGWGTALKPAHEPIVVARKPLNGTVAANVLQYGTGALNIDGCRIGDPPGRWPANVIHDGSDEVVGLFPESISSAPSATATYGTNRDGRENSTYGKGLYSATPNRPPIGDSGSAARFFYAAKASRAERNAGLDGLPAEFAPTMGNGIGGKEHDPETATRKQNTHPTVKPLALMRYLLKLVTPPGGTTLDPFAGSGTTLVAAIHENLNSIGIELTPEYHPIIQARINHAQATRQTTTQPGILDPCAS
jgi:DNA modification methylase